MRVAISGKIASGKTSVANHLFSKYGFTRLSIASYVKRFEYIQTEVDDKLWPLYVESLVRRLVHYSHDDLPPSIGISPYERDMNLVYELTDLIVEELGKLPYMPGKKNRELYQRIGTDIMRAYLCDDIWVNALLATLPKSQDINLVVDDLRFKNEFIKLKANNFITIRLCVSKEVQKSRIDALYSGSHYTDEQLHHRSETDLDDQVIMFDHLVNADIPLEDMLATIDRILGLRENICIGEREEL